MRDAKRAYRALVKKWHPDQFNHDRGLQQIAEDKLKAINQAYSALLNPDQSFQRLRYGRPTAGQHVGRARSAGDSHDGWQSQSWGAGPFHYQSSYYRTRQSRAAGGSSRRSVYGFAYAPGVVQTGAPVPRWAIMLVLFFAIAMANTFTSSIVNGSSSRSYASSPAPLSRPQVTNFMPIVTMSENELKEQKQRESQAAAARGVPVPLILRDEGIRKVQHEPAAGKKDSQVSSQKKTSAPPDASPGK
jgi:hypothetical protein